MFKGKTIIVIGARQVGKTTLVRTIPNGKSFLFLDGDPLVRNRLTRPNIKEIEAIIGKFKIVFIDEAQRIEDIGLTAKMIHDQFKGVQLIMSGSSAFELRNHTNEQLTGVDKNTVYSYIHLLELSYIVYPVTSFSRNLRNEIKTNRKIYFYDNGVRNALIQNFNPLGLRNDIGALWENFLMSERLKRNHYHNYYCNKYFWRTKQQQEIDYVEERDGKITGFEFKWNLKAKTKIPADFIKAYNADVTIISKENFRDSVGLFDD